MATGDASHVLRISRRWRSCSSTVKIPSTARSVDSDISGQKCSTSAVGSDASAGLSQERIKLPVTTWTTVGWCRPMRQVARDKLSPCVASVLYTGQKFSQSDNFRPQSVQLRSERPGRRGLTRPFRSQGKTESSIRARAPAVANRLRATAGGLRRRPLQPRCVACDADAVALRWLVAPRSRRHC